MKILLTGGGTGGHFYPLIAIAEELNSLAQKEKIIDMKLYYMSDSPYDKRMLFENRITYIQIPAGKLRRYFSIRNFLDYFSTAIGAFFGLLSMFFIYPDVVISKGGYAAFPAVFAAKLLRIPVIVHESDSSPGRLNLWTAKFAKRIAVSWPEAGEKFAVKFPKDKIALAGQPIRKAILHGDPQGAKEFFKLEGDAPIIFIYCGSQGAQMVNNVILEALPELLEKYQIIHQTGPKLYDEVVGRSRVVLGDNPNIIRYKPIAYLNNLAVRMASGAASLVISRAGSTIFEIASWGVPSIIIPITDSNGDHQRKNAFSYARTGGAQVIEENNLTPHILLSDIDAILSNPQKIEAMKKSATLFSNPNAAGMIAQEAIDIALSHES